MSVNNKRTLSYIIYFTLVPLAFLLSFFFAYILIARDVKMWIRVIYLIWLAVVCFTLIYDIVCSCLGKMKFSSGLIIYVLSVIAVIMAVLLYVIYTRETGLPADFLHVYVSLVVLSLSVSASMIAAYLTGESLIENATAVDKLNK